MATATALEWAAKPTRFSAWSDGNDWIADCGFKRAGSGGGIAFGGEGGDVGFRLVALRLERVDFRGEQFYFAAQRIGGDRRFISDWRSSVSSL